MISGFSVAILSISIWSLDKSRENGEASFGCAKRFCVLFSSNLCTQPHLKTSWRSEVVRCFDVNSWRTMWCNTLCVRKSFCTFVLLKNFASMRVHAEALSFSFFISCQTQKLSFAKEVFTHVCFEESLSKQLLFVPAFQRLFCFLTSEFSPVSNFDLEAQILEQFRKNAHENENKFCCERHSHL